ncbi:MAG: M28 family metallopeptidase [Coriobacteriia bacterium]
MPKTTRSSDELTARIRAHVAHLCAAGDRHPGTERNRAATDYVASVMRDLGLVVDELPFEVPDWQPGDATITAGTREFWMHPGPFSTSVEADGPLVLIDRAADLDSLDARGCVVLVHGEIAQIQLTPRGYPFYEDAEHAAIAEALEASGALAIVAATEKNPSMTAGMSPFPLIEEPGFALPTAYLHADEGAELALHDDETVHVHIDSRTVPSTGVQPIGRRTTGSPRRVIVAAHVDTKPGTPGALDNASGDAVMLAAAELMAGVDLEVEVEFVPFNGEDHVLAAGELAYLRATDLRDVELMVNIDGAGLPGSPSAYSCYNLDAPLAERLSLLAADTPSVVLGDSWPASDHMIFAMQGIPAVAITSLDFATASGVYSHTPLDTPDVLDYALLAETARFVAALVGTAV